MIFNFEYCFLSDIGCGDFSKNSLRICSILPPKNVFQINEKEYKDPDMYSETLYKYHKEIWKKELPSGGKISDINNVSENNSGCKITAKVGKKNVYLGSDYIGFSKNWIPGGSDVKDIENALMKSRTFGGHILFAKGFFTGWFYCKKDKKIHYEKSNIYDWYKREYQKDDVNDMYKNLMIYTINTSKGGEKSFYDRFDWTLIMMQIYYECINETSDELRIIQFLEKSNAILKKIVVNQKYSDVQEVLSMYDRFVNMYYGLDNSREWLKYFKDFSGFANYFRLKKSFVDDNDNIIESAPLLPVLPIEYKDYMNKTVSQILNRNKELELKFKPKSKETYLEPDEYLLNKEVHPYAYECPKCNRIIENDENYSIPPVCDECSKRD